MGSWTGGRHAGHKNPKMCSRKERRISQEQKPLASSGELDALTGHEKVNQLRKKRRPDEYIKPGGTSITAAAVSRDSLAPVGMSTVGSQPKAIRENRQVRDGDGFTWNESEREGERERERERGEHTCNPETSSHLNIRVLLLQIQHDVVGA